MEKINSKTFVIKPFFTGCINLEGKNINQIYSEFNNLRKRKINKNSNELVTKISKNYKILDRLSGMSNPKKPWRKIFNNYFSKYSIKAEIWNFINY